MDRLDRILNHDHWASADGDTDAGGFALRFRTPVVERGQARDLAHCVLVCWSFAAEGEGALPDAEHCATMEAFEDRLGTAWEDEGLAFLAAVLTFDGARQFVYYTSDVEACDSKLAEVRESADPIEVTTQEDPEWGYLHHEILGLVDWEEHQAEWEAALDS